MNPDRFLTPQLDVELLSLDLTKECTPWFGKVNLIVLPTILCKIMTKVLSFCLTAPLSEETIEKLKATFYDDPKNVLAQNACTRVEPLEICTSRCRVQETQHVFSHKVSPWCYLLFIYYIFILLDDG